jgi:hypothetical protein
MRREEPTCVPEGAFEYVRRPLPFRALAYEPDWVAVNPTVHPIPSMRVLAFQKGLSVRPFLASEHQWNYAVLWVLEYSWRAGLSSCLGTVDWAEPYGVF